MGSTTPTAGSKTVAVIGAGASGVAAAAHLKAWGLDVTVFERTQKAGGVWVYDERTPPEVPFPNVRPSRADFTAFVEEDWEDWEGDEGNEGEGKKRTNSGVLNGENGVTESKNARRKRKTNFKSRDEAEIWHAPPGPAYTSLKNNIPTAMMEMKLGPWPAGTPMHTSHKDIAAYVQDLARKHGVLEVTRFGVRVDRAEKVESEMSFENGDGIEKAIGEGQGKWKLWTTKLVAAGDGDGDGDVAFEEEVWEFDFLVVATGHYHACNVPDLPGLKEWKTAFPNRVQHSKSYRTSRGFEDKTVLLIGGAVSSTDIAIDLAPSAKKIYQSTRGGHYDLPPAMLPEKATRIGPVASFSSLTTSTSTSASPANSNPNSNSDGPIPGTVTLANGDVLDNIDVVILCTGYLCAYPFLQQYHDDNMDDAAADEKVIITKTGQQTHNLHLDIFYIPCPSLSFVGVPYHVATFSLYEFQAIAIAAVYSGKVRLPDEKEMRKEYEARKEEKGAGRAFNGLKGKDVEYVKALLEWVNGELERGGELERKVEGHSEAWIAGQKWFHENVIEKFGFKFGPDKGEKGGKGGEEKKALQQEEVLTEVVPGTKV